MNDVFDRGLMRSLIAETVAEIAGGGCGRKALVELVYDPFLYSRTGMLEFCFLTTRWGRVLAASLDGDVCELRFADRGDGCEVECLRKRYPQADVAECEDVMTEERLDAVIRGEEGVRVIIGGTRFGWTVLKAVAEVPFGGVVGYGCISRQIGRPLASRAVGHAVGQNPVALIVPCHRVLRTDGGIGGYAYGIDRKKQILRDEFKPKI